MEGSREEQSGKSGFKGKQYVKPKSSFTDSGGRKRGQLTLNVSEGDRAVWEALAEYWACSLSETARTMLRHFEVTLKLDVRGRGRE